MLTYELKKAPGVPLYEALYRCIRADILSGNLAPGTKLPSKRALAANLKVSKITVEAAYDQLLAEGYLRSREKIGYFVETVERQNIPSSTSQPVFPPKPSNLIDLTGGTGHFPFSVWSKLQRQVLLEQGQALLQPLPNQGIPQLRRAIADQLAGFRGLPVDPENVLIGAGTDFLYNLLIQLLGRDKVYAVEDPGYSKIRKIYAAGGVVCNSAPMDSQGVIPDSLGNAQVLHISPSHHFPTGLITPLGRRQALLDWANSAPDRFIIEDDYDTEFRFAAHPMPALSGMDAQGKVIYMNTFSRTLAPSIRISYMVLPGPLMAQFREKLGFYSCTVPSFEQYTLSRFLEEGHFEKHINRMRKAYRATRNRLITILEHCPVSSRMSIQEQNAGLHFLLRVDSGLSDLELIARCEALGVRVQALSHFYHDSQPPEAAACLVVNYAGLTNEDLDRLEQILNEKL